MTITLSGTGSKILPSRTALLMTAEVEGTGPVLVSGTILQPLVPGFQRVGVLACMGPDGPTQNARPGRASLLCCCLDEGLPGPTEFVKYVPASYSPELRLLGDRMIERIRGQLNMRVEVAQTRAQQEAWDRKETFHVTMVSDA